MDISHWDAAIHYGVQLAQYCDQTRSCNHGREPDGVTSCYPISQDGGANRTKVGQSIFSIWNGFLVRFVVCTSSYWFGQQSFTNLIMMCYAVIAYKSREVLKRDGVTLLCWWGNIHKFCISDEVTSYLQSMYFTIPVITRAWILLKIHVLWYRWCI